MAIRFSMITLILATLVLGLQYRLWIGEGSIAHVSFLDEKIQEKKKENSDKQFRNKELKAEIEDLKYDTQALEAIARNELGLIKAGEKFFLLPEK